ncbi:hypothetical protein MNBD_NITROSPINAE01-815 [hydrothermal vent metagenome]|uniref:Zinc finger DksA/TraR C4-type domain-containing protein n=1 Tax=hydrothermal vent metagenome TaxID=652676 RepID=A0A3B1C1I4_9ZZZZ
MPHITETELQNFKTALENLQAKLLSITLNSADEDATVELDQARFGRLSRMDAMQVQAMNAESVRRRKVELVKIEAALRRIEEGDYGYCVKCDEEISKERLQVGLSAPMCIDCANKSEQRK